MPEAVIVATARSPIGRAGKGSLASIRPDDLAVQMVAAALTKVPQLDPADIGDLILGCGLPGGEQGFNLARVVAVLLGHDHLPCDQGRRGRCIYLGRSRVREQARQGQQRFMARHQEPFLRRRPGTDRTGR